MKTLAIIPSRYASSRFPGKPLIDIDGKSMIQRVYEQALKAKTPDRVIIATDDQEIHSTVRSFLLNKIKIYDRSKENALDVSSTESVMLEYIINNKVHNEDIFILVQATSPFTTSSDLSKAKIMAKECMSSGYKKCQK